MNDDKIVRVVESVPTASNGEALVDGKPVKTILATKVVETYYESGRKDVTVTVPRLDLKGENKNGKRHL